jgi:hypothetical protein
MKVKIATVTLGAALILAGAPGLASVAAMQHGPIQINRVKVSGGSFSDPEGFETTTLPGAVAISFTNRKAATANDVVFGIEMNGHVAKRFNDVGSFSTGTTINHRFPENNPTGRMRVVVEKATFDDGSVWINPEVSDPPVDPSAMNNDAGFVATRYF